MRRLIAPANLENVHRLLIATLAPLDKWTGAVVSKVEDPILFEYAIMSSLLQLSTGVIAHDRVSGTLNDLGREQVARCFEDAQTFLIQQDKSYDTMGFEVVPHSRLHETRALPYPQPGQILEEGA